MMVSSNELLFQIKIFIVLAEESVCIDAVHDSVGSEKFIINYECPPKCEDKKKTKACKKQKKKGKCDKKGNVKKCAKTCGHC